MDIDFIKWMCEKADGFSFFIESDGYPWIKKPDNTVCSLKSIESFGMKTSYPLLLQRAIEGVNSLHINNDDYPVIETDQYQLFVWYSMSRNAVFDYEKFETIDKAKESALKYIFDKEREG